MSTVVDQLTVPPVAFPTNWTMADLQAYLGDVSASRIRLFPAPGTATEEDALRLEDREDRLCELVDGVLVEKAMSFYESIIAMQLGYLLVAYLEKNNIGVVTGADGQIRLHPTKMRIPDVALIRWDRFPGNTLPKDRVCKVAPDLAVEVFSKGNTPREMELKLGEYFEAGVRLVWYIDPSSRTARIFTARDQSTTIDENGKLEGGEVLPGFQVRLGELFERAERRQGT
jgi:Uma2 family endonuclease